jgi:hypothetical protein
VTKIKKLGEAMWDCLKCGCRAIAHGLTRCPKCKKEADVPKTTVDGGGTNGPGPDDAAAPPEPEKASAKTRAKAADKAPEPQDVTGSGGITLPKLGGGNG